MTGRKSKLIICFNNYLKHKLQKLNIWHLDFDFWVCLKNMFTFHKKLNENEILKWGILGGAAESLYIFLVALFFDILENFFIQAPSGPINFFTFFLLFFVVSAVISVIIIFGRPGYLFFNKKLKEGMLTLVTTLITLLVIFLLVFSLMITL